MVEHQRQRREMDAQLKRQLDEKHELEKSIECTFTPKTVYSSYASPSHSGSLMDQMQPLIEQEHRLLLQLQSIDEADSMRAKEASMPIYNFIVSNNIVFGSNCSGEYKRRLDCLTCDYRKQRLQDVALVKNQKLDVVGQIQELERRFNIVAVGASVDLNDMAKAGFSIENCRRIKNEVLEGIRGHETLKDRCRISAELDVVILRAHEAVAMQQQQKQKEQRASRDDLSYPSPRPCVPLQQQQQPQLQEHPYWQPGGQPQLHQRPIWNFDMPGDWQNPQVHPHHPSHSANQHAYGRGAYYSPMDTVRRRHHLQNHQGFQQQHQHQHRQQQPQPQLGNYFKQDNVAYAPNQGHVVNAMHGSGYSNATGYPGPRGPMLMPRVATCAGGTMGPRPLVSRVPPVQNQHQLQHQLQLQRHQLQHRRQWHRQGPMMQRLNTSPMFVNRGKSNSY